ncbi:MAG: LysM peptidoglycan-binding domain-containing protein [Caldilineaceae bacterium]
MLFDRISRVQIVKALVRAVLALGVGLLALLPVTTPALAEDDLHVVRAGELLATIAQRYDVDVADLAALNGIDDPNLIVPGQSLIIPGTRRANPYGAPALSAELPADGGYYTVQPGDSLSTIALRYAMTQADLMRLNGLSDPSFVWVGQQLRVTARARPLVTDMVDAPAQQAARIHVVAAGDSLSAIAQTYGTTVDELLIANGLPNANFVFVGQRLRVPASRAVQDMTMAVAGAPEDGARRIEVNLSAQTLTAYQGDVAIMQTTVSTGKWSTPTVQGTFHIGTKYASQDMYGDDYYLPGVPWVMYFYEGFAIHGAYWHANFGTPTSHGCVNMRPDEAEILFDWAAQGTEVVVYQ